MNNSNLGGTHTTDMHNTLTNLFSAGNINAYMADIWIGTGNISSSDLSYIYNRGASAPSGVQFLYGYPNNQTVSVHSEMVPAATGYHLYRSTDNVTFNQILSNTSPSFTDTSAIVGTKYYYQIKAANAVGESIASPSIVVNSFSLSSSAGLMSFLLMGN